MNLRVPHSITIQKMFECHMVWEFLKVFRLYKHHKSILVTKNPRKTPLCSICSYAVGPWHEPSKSWIAAVWWWPEMKLQNHGGYTRVELFDAVIVDLNPCIHACCLWTKKYTMQNNHIKLNPLLVSRSRISCLPFFLLCWWPIYAWFFLYIRYII